MNSEERLLQHVEQNRGILKRISKFGSYTLGLGLLILAPASVIHFGNTTLESMCSNPITANPSCDAELGLPNKASSVDSEQSAIWVERGVYTTGFGAEMMALGTIGASTLTLAHKRHRRILLNRSLHVSNETAVVHKSHMQKRGTL